MRSPSLKGFAAEESVSAAASDFAGAAAGAVDRDVVAALSADCLSVLLAERSLELQPGRISKTKRMGRRAQRGRGCVMFNSRGVFGSRGTIEKAGLYYMPAAKCKTTLKNDSL